METLVIGARAVLAVLDLGDEEASLGVAGYRLTAGLSDLELARVAARFVEVVDDVAG